MKYILVGSLGILAMLLFVGVAYAFYLNPQEMLCQYYCQYGDVTMSLLTGCDPDKCAQTMYIGKAFGLH